MFICWSTGSALAPPLGHSLWFWVSGPHVSRESFYQMSSLSCPLNPNPSALSAGLRENTSFPHACRLSSDANYGVEAERKPLCPAVYQEHIQRADSFYQAVFTFFFWDILCRLEDKITNSLTFESTKCQLSRFSSLCQPCKRFLFFYFNGHHFAVIYFSWVTLCNLEINKCMVMVSWLFVPEDLWK